MYNPISELERTKRHRETYIAAINSALAERGAKQAYAAKLGITPQYLSYLLDEWGTRVPSRSMAVKMANAAPVPAEERKELLHHLLQANPNTAYVDPLAHHTLTTEEAHAALVTVSASEFSTLIAKTPEEVNQGNRRALNVGKWALERINSRDNPFTYTEIAMHLHNAASSMNLPISAFWYAKSALDITQNADLWLDTPYEDLRLDRLIDSWRKLSVTYHNLGLPKQSLHAVQMARECLKQVGNPALNTKWVAHLAMEELNAIAIMPRFAITHAESIAERGLNSLGFGPEPRKMRDILGALIQRNLIETYIHHGSPKSLRLAEYRVTDVFTEDHLPNLGALAHAMHLRTGANLAHKLGDVHSYRDWLLRAHKLSTEAGLAHQCAEIEAEVRRYLN